MEQDKLEQVKMFYIFNHCKHNIILKKDYKLRSDVRYDLYSFDGIPIIQITFLILAIYLFAGVTSIMKKKILKVDQTLHV